MAKMKNKGIHPVSQKRKWIHHKWLFLVVILLLFGCYSTKNRTEKRAKERVMQFMFLMTQDRIGEAEKLLAYDLVDSGNKEFFLSNFDDLKIEIQEIYFPKNIKNRALVSMTIRSEKSGFSKIISMPIRYEKGDWYLGA
jgi:hypothetical protein